MVGKILVAPHPYYPSKKSLAPVKKKTVSTIDQAFISNPSKYSAMIIPRIPCVPLKHMFHIVPFFTQMFPSGWWFEPPWKILVNWDDDIPNINGKIQKMATKPPTSHSCHPYVPRIFPYSPDRMGCLECRTPRSPGDRCCPGHSRNPQLKRMKQVPKRRGKDTWGYPKWLVYIMNWRWEWERDIYIFWLVVQPPLWKMMDFVNWDDDINPIWMGTIKNWWQPNHPSLFIAFKNWTLTSIYLFDSFLEGRYGL